MLIASYDSVLTTQETNHVAHELAAALLSRCQDTPDGIKLSELLDSADYVGLCDHRLDYAALAERGFVGSTLALRLRAVQALFQKRNDLDLGINKEEVAFKEFLRSEQRCFETNSFFRELHAGRIQTRPVVASWMFQAQQKIAAILGDTPTWEEVKFRLGPGATTRVKKKNASVVEKLRAPLQCSGDLSPVVARLLEEMPHLVGFNDRDAALVDVEIHHARLGFVPKNWKTFRGIVVEPSLNMIYQLGLGDFMAERLRKFGVDIRDQTRNQQLAREGSISGELATLDLSSASDLISKELVRSLLPVDWYEILSAGRSSLVRYGDNVFELEKFSSMGNGYTFPLETVIFYSLAWSVCLPTERRYVSAYGDDIIVPSHRYKDLVELLSVCGFEVNPSKSYAQGPFRESCGADYLLGNPVRPPYLRDQLSGDSAFVLHNQYFRLGLFECASIIRKHIADTVAIYGPDGFGDGHLLGFTSEYELAPYKRHLGYAGYTFESYAAIGRRQKYHVNSLETRLATGLLAYSIYRRNGTSSSAAVPRRLPNLTRLALRSYALKESESTDLEYLQSTVDGQDREWITLTLPGSSKGYKRIRIYTFGG